MFFTTIVSLLIICNFESPQCNALPDQWSAWRNPYYRDNYGQDGTVTTTTTTKPLYPTLHPRDFPTAPFDPYPNYDFGQRQGPVNPFTGQPLLPQHSQQPYHPQYDNSGRNRNQTFDNRIGYPNNPNNPNYPNNNDNNTRSTPHTTYPPFNGSTRRNTFPTRRNFNTLPTMSSTFNHTWHANPNNTLPQYNNNNNNNNNPHYHGHSHRQFPNPQQNDGRNQFNANHNQPQYPNLNSFMTSRSSIPTPSLSNEQSRFPQQPDYHPSGVALAPFADEDQNANRFGARKHFNYDNLYRRQPQSDIDINSRGFDHSMNSQVPLANYGGSHIPLAPL